MVDPHVPIIQDLDQIRNCQVWIRDYFQRNERRQMHRRQNARRARAIAAQNQARLREINLNQVELKFTHEYRAWYRGDYHNANPDHSILNRTDFMLYDYDKAYEMYYDKIIDPGNYLFTMVGSRMFNFLAYDPTQFENIIRTYQTGCLKRIGVTVRLSQEANTTEENNSLSLGQEFSAAIVNKEDYQPMYYNHYIFPQGRDCEERFAKMQSLPQRLIWTYTELKNKGYKRKFYDLEIDNGWGRGWRNSNDFDGRNLRIVPPFVFCVGANQTGMPRGSPIFSFFVDFYFTFRRNGA